MKVKTGYSVPVWLQWCQVCKRRHYMTMDKCSACGVHLVPTPVFEGAASSCGADYSCDGCLAYKDHLC